MRLIDADALERDGWQMSRTVQIDKATMEFQTRKPTDFPTIEPQRIRGRWIDDGQYGDNFPHHAWHCSECGESVIEIDTPWYRYCPNCGADMRGEENE